MTIPWRRLAALGWVALLVLLIVGPWLLPGYFFGTDFPGPRHFAFPDAPASYAGLQLTLAVVALVLPGDIVGKLLIFGTLFTAGMTAYQAVPMRGFIPRAAASLVYLVNPFVYDRLAYGQIGVLAGYAVLPWVALSIRDLLQEPMVKRALIVSMALVVVSILDIHMGLIAALLVTSLVLGDVLTQGSNLIHVARLCKSLIVSGGLAVGLSAYWVIPLLRGIGAQARTVQSIGEGDLSAFAAVSDPNVGLLPNVLGLYGFWAEETGRFVSMKQFVPEWPALLLAFLGLSVIGAAVAWRADTSISGASHRAWVLGLIMASIVAGVLEVGISDPHTAPLVRWLDVVFPLYRGMRDSSKWAGVLALAYSQLIPFGAVGLADWLRSRQMAARPREFVGIIAASVALALPLYYGNGLLYGMHGQIQTSSYPAGWYAADHALAADPHPGKSLFLPWHGYLALSFVRNANRVVASPAPMFFSVPVVASQDLEVPGVAPPHNDPDQTTVARLVAAGGEANWSLPLAERNIKYVLVARELDWRSYDYLAAQPGLALVGDYGSILVYRNQQWH